MVWREHLLSESGGKSPSTVNNSLSMVRGLLRRARQLGWIDWGIDVRGVAYEPVRDMRGPGEQAVQRLIRETESRPRDRAILLLLAIQGLRRSEISSADVGSFDPGPPPTLSIRRKRRRARVRVPLAGEVAAAVAELVRGRDALEPLFVGRRGARLGGQGIWYLMRRIAREAGITVPVRPHGLRHFAGTTGLDIGDPRGAAALLGHRNLESLAFYDDSRDRAALELAERIAARLVPPKPE